MKLWNKFCIAFALYVLIALVNALLTYEEIGNITKKMILVEVADDLKNNILEVRRHEKNYLLFRDESDLATLKQYLGELTRDIYSLEKEVVTAVGISNYEAMKKSMVEYTLLIDYISQTRNGDKNVIEKMRSEARKIEGFIKELSKKERVRIKSALRKAGDLLFLAVASLLILGPLIIIVLARSIVTPIRRLEHLTKKIADGDFTEQIEVKGKDEIASLSIAFNQMEEKLRDSMKSLEYAIKMLQEKQAQLVAAEKLASVGILAAGIAHEINNPLTSVLTFSNLLLEQCPVGDPRHEKLKMMARDTDRARNIVKQLLSFAKETPMRHVKMNVNDLIKEIVESLNAQDSFRNIELALNLSDNLPAIYADPGQIRQVILNILLNAIHAIRPPGKIGVSTGRMEKFVEMVFTDTGCGIPEDHLSKVFDPFFTTKEVNKGTGLGLAVSYGIIKRHGGNIEVKSAVGKGTTFIVKLPVE